MAPVPGGAPASRRRAALHLLAIAVLVLAAYSGTFRAPFQLDDIEEISDNPIVRNPEYFLHPSAADGLPGAYGLKMRYLGYLSFALDYAVHGQDVFGYHAVNVAIHIANAFLLYALVALTFRAPAMREVSGGSAAAWAPFLAALLFACHPVQTEAVTYVVQRLASLAAMFCLLSIAAYAKWRLAPPRERRLRSAAWYAGTVLAAAAAMKTKEIAFTFPLVIAAYEFTFFSGDRRRRIASLAPLLLTMLIVPAGLLGGGAPLGEWVGRLGAASRVESVLTRGEYLLTQFGVIATYLRLVLLPVSQNLDYDYPVYRSFLDPTVLSSFLLLAALLGLGVWLRVRGGKGRPLLLPGSFGIFWFFLALSVESSVIPISDVIFEHRLYLPSAGAFLAFVALAFAVCARFGTRRVAAEHAVVVAVTAAALVLAAATHARNEVWRSGVTLWSDVVSKSPDKYRGYLNLGIAYDHAGDYDKALAAYRKADARKPGDADVLFNMGIAYAAKGMTDDAIREYRRVLALRPGLARAHFNLGVSYLTRGDAAQAREQFLAVLRLDPGSYQARQFLDYAERMGGGAGRAAP